MTYYRNIQPVGELIDADPDEFGRAQCTFSVLVTKRPSTTYVLELVAILVAAGVGVANVSIFGTSASAIPSGDGPYLSIRPTAGTAPTGTHNDGTGAYRNPSAQILVTAKTWTAAEAMAQAAYSALIAVRNRNVEVA
jgi:hypothetical protein